MPLVSVIIPVFNEEENLPVLYQRLNELLINSKDSFEFIFIDDGSSDGSFSLLKELSGKDIRVRAIKFSRNFGSHAACLAGLEHSKGDACTFISADLQDPPEMIQTLIDEWKKGNEVVIGIRNWDDNSIRLFQRIYYRLVRRYALQNMPEGGTDVFLIDRKVIDAVVSMKEKNTSVFGLILWSGFKQSVVTYKKGVRHKGISKWTTGKKIKLFIDTFVSFSYFPLRMISVLGILFAFLGFLYASFIIFNRLFFSVPVEGWASLMVVLLVVSGVQLAMLGIIGEYLWRNFDSSRKRPAFIIDERIGYKDRIDF
ncbi:MAG: glycosyltransferase family 2 protein [Nitrospira sp.]|nr:glycosyltransferase family 2 protein [Nitrospira sp.]